MLAKTDVVVIGGGVIGCAVAYYLSKKDLRVTVVERDVVGSGASSVNTGAIALGTKRGGMLLALAAASQKLHAGLSRELGMETEYEVEGNLIIAETDDEVRYMDELEAAQREAGVPIERVSPARCREINPLLEAPLLAGLYCATDAHANPFKVTYAYACAAEKRGVEILAHTRVEGIEVERGRVRRVVTSHGAIDTRWIVNAAGAYAPDIGHMVGVTHEVIPRRGQIVVLEACERMPAVRVSGARQLMAKHTAKPGDGLGTRVSLSYTSKPRSGTVLLGSTNEFAGYDTRNTLDVVTGICATASRFMPRLAELNAVRAWAGLRPYSAKGPLLGHVNGPDGYLLATGHGGDGMALAPITGVYLSELVSRDGAAYAITDLLDTLVPLRSPAAMVQ
jgi:sarcosine oxidase subunit beta